MNSQPQASRVPSSTPPSTPPTGRHNAPFRRRAFAVGLALALVFAAAWLVFWPRAADGDTQAAGPTRAGVSASERTAPDEVERTTAAAVAARSELPLDAKPAPASVSALAPAHERVHPAWPLVAELEQCAQDTASFHARALPVVERLEAACRAEPLSLASAANEASGGAVHITGAPAPSATSKAPDAVPPAATPVSEVARIADELFTRVVLSQEQSALVRGAVLVALAQQLDERSFWTVFDDWFAAGARTHDELLRSLWRSLRASPRAARPRFRTTSRCAWSASCRRLPV